MLQVFSFDFRDGMEGLTELCMARVTIVVKGQRFFVGAPVVSLAKSLAAKKKTDVLSLAMDEMCRYIVSLTPEEIHDLGGFCAMVTEGQVIRIPAGHIVAECNYGCAALVISWLSLAVFDVKGCGRPVVPEAMFSDLSVAWCGQLTT
jgi:hypothetical protein